MIDDEDLTEELDELRERLDAIEAYLERLKEAMQLPEDDGEEV